jgi:hypothetical protein
MREVCNEIHSEERDTTPKLPHVEMRVVKNILLADPDQTGKLTHQRSGIKEQVIAERAEDNIDILRSC